MKTSLDEARLRLYRAASAHHMDIESEAPDFDRSMQTAGELEAAACNYASLSNHGSETASLRQQLEEAKAERNERQGRIECLQADIANMRYERDAAIARVAELEQELTSLKAHHEATHHIINDAQGQSPENGKALLHNMDQLKERVAELEAQCVNRLHGNFTFAYCIIFLRNSNERLLAIKITADAFGIGFAAARDWVDSVKMERRVINMDAARKTLEEYPADISDVEDRIEYSISHWPALSTTAGTSLLARVKELEKDKALIEEIESNAWTLKCCEDLGYDDADVHWEVIEYHMAEPKERMIGYGRTPREALSAAMAKDQEKNAGGVR